MRILLVDDIDFNLLMLKRLLEKSKYDIITAKSGFDALDILAGEEKVDLVITDLLLGDMDGIQLYLSCQKFQKYAGLLKALMPPFILTTSSQEVEKHKKAKAAGFLEVLAKPFEPELLVQLAHDVQTGQYLLNQKADKFLKIMVVGQPEDQHISDKLSGFLQGTGHTVSFSTSGAAGLSQLEMDLDLSVILTCEQLSDMTGLDLCAKAQKIMRYNDDGIVPTPPIMMIFNKASLEKMEQAKAIGVTDFFVQPIRYEEMIKRLAQLLESEESNETQQKKVMVVDDIGFSRSLMEKIVKDLGYEVILASSGTQALKILCRERSISLVLCDLNMPDMSGMELFHEYLRTVKGNGQIGLGLGQLVADFVLVTASQDMTVLSKAQDMGILAVFKKPVQPQEMKSYILSYFKMGQREDRAAEEEVYY